MTAQWSFTRNPRWVIMEKIRARQHKENPSLHSLSTSLYVELPPSQKTGIWYYCTTTRHTGQASLTHRLTSVQIMLQYKDILGLNFRFKGELYYWYIINLSSTVHKYSLFLTLSFNVSHSHCTFTRNPFEHLHRTSTKRWLQKEVHSKSKYPA